MDLWIYDEEATATEERVACAARLGFTRWLAYSRVDLDNIAQACLDNGVGLMPIVASWGDIKNTHPEFAMLNWEGVSSFSSVDPIVPPNTWPSPWAPEALDIIRDQPPLLAQQAGEAFAGFVVGTGEGDATCMPQNWHRCPDGGRLSTEYFCFDKWALAEWKSRFPGTLPARSPAEDTDKRTLRFMQRALLRRLDEIAQLAVAAGAPEVWSLVLPFTGASYLVQAMGYFGLHEKLARWSHEFSQQHGIVTGMLIPHLFQEADGGVPDQVAAAAFLADSEGCDCRVLVGVDVATADWEKNLLRDGSRIEGLGLTGLLCDPVNVSNPKNEKKVRQILAEIDTKAHTT